MFFFCLEGGQHVLVLSIMNLASPPPGINNEWSLSDILRINFFVALAATEPKRNQRINKLQTSRCVALTRDKAGGQGKVLRLFYRSSASRVQIITESQS